MFYFSVGLKLLAHDAKVYGPASLMDLHGIAPAERDVGASFAGQVRKLATLAGLATGTRFIRGHFRAVIAPYVKGKQSTAKFIVRTHQKLDGFRSLD